MQIAHITTAAPLRELKKLSVSSPTAPSANANRSMRGRRSSMDPESLGGPLKGGYASGTPDVVTDSRPMACSGR